jgi:hypothetical protein
MVTVVGFELPMTDSAIRYLLDTEVDMTEGWPPLPMTAVEPPITETIQQELGDTPFTLYSGDVGRGASGYGVAFEIANIVATFGGAIATMAGGIQLTRRIYKKLRELLGRPPMISLGTAVYLAAADLAERFPNGDFRVHGFGDTNGRQSDSSYTGFDCFYVIFERDAELFFYAVDARGEVKYLSDMRLNLPY